MSKFCINGTTDPQSSTEFQNILVDMNAGGITLGVVLLIGCVFSIIPQHVKIIKTNSVIGLSFLWMFLGNVNQFSGFINIFVLKFPQIQACSVVGFKDCGPSLLSIFQAFGIWIISFPIYTLYLIYCPKDLKLIEKQVPQDFNAAKREYRTGQTFFSILVIFLVVIIIVVSILLSDIVGVCTHTTYIFGYSMGILSTVVTFVQWSPQIYKTIRDKAVGSFSIIMLCIQGPGSLINLYFLIFVSHESLSTWLPYLCSAIQIFLLLALLIYFDRKNKSLEREKKDLESVDEIDKFSGSPNQSILNYKETLPLLSNKLAINNNNDNNNKNGDGGLNIGSSIISNSIYNKSYLNDSTNSLDDDIDVDDNYNDKSSLL